MIEVLPDWAPTGGAVAMLGAVVWAIIRGTLIPGSTHERIVADKDEQIRTWRAAHDKVAEQRDELLVTAHVGAKALDAVATAATKGAAS